MANQKNQLINIPLNGPLNFNKLKSSITQYTGFNKLNSPIYGEAISPLYKSDGTTHNRPYLDVGTNGELAIYDKEGHLFQDLQNQYLIQKKKLVIKDDFDRRCIAYWDEDSYAYIETNNLKLHTPAKELYLAFISNMTPIVRYLTTGEILTVTYNFGEVKFSLYSHEGEEVYTDSIPITELKDSETLLASLNLSTIVENKSRDYKIVGYLASVKATNPKERNSCYYSRQSQGSLTFNGTDNTAFKNYCIYLPTGEDANKTKTIEVKPFTIYNDTIPGSETVNLSSRQNILAENGVIRYIKKGENQTYSFSSLAMLPASPSNIISRASISGKKLTMSFPHSVDLTIDFYSRTISTKTNKNDFISSEISNCPDTFYISLPNCIGQDVLYIGCFVADTLDNAKTTGVGVTFQRSLATAGGIANENYNSREPLGSSLKMPEGFSKAVCFNRLYSNGVLSNYSVSLSYNVTGSYTEISGSVDLNSFPTFRNTSSDVYSSYSLIYKSENGYWYEIQAILSSYSFLEHFDINNFISYNKDKLLIRSSLTQNYFYEEEGSLRPDILGIDYNNRIFTKKVQIDFTKYIINFISTGYNLNYEVTKKLISSEAYPPTKIAAEYINNTHLESQNENTNLIDLYISTGRDTVPEYKSSLDGLYNVDPTKIGLKAPINSTVIPSIFSELIFSDFNQLFIKDDNNSYLAFSNQTRNYYTSSFRSIIFNIENIFAIQGSTYIANDGYIFPAIKAADGIYDIGQAIVSTKGLKYCGCLPTFAVFYSPRDKTLQRFGADNTLAILAQATEIDDVYLTEYDPATQSLYICTNNGVYIYSTFGQYKLDLYNVRDITFENELVYFSFEDSISDQVAYSFAEKDNFNLIPVKLSTRYYGNGENLEVENDCIYIRLYNNKKVLPNKTTVKVSSAVVVNTEIKSEEHTYNIIPSDWDYDTNTCLIRYQPTYQKGSGIEVNIEAECSIYSIVFSTSPIVSVTIPKKAIKL